MRISCSFMALAPSPGVGDVVGDRLHDRAGGVLGRRADILGTRGDPLRVHSEVEAAFGADAEDELAVSAEVVAVLVMAEAPSDTCAEPGVDAVMLCGFHAADVDGPR